MCIRDRCYGYDIAATGGDMSIRYALVRHRHNNGQLSNDKVYIPVDVYKRQGVCRELPELKHLSRARKRNQPRFRLSLIHI